MSISFGIIASITLRRELQEILKTPNMDYSLLKYTD